MDIKELYRLFLSCGSAVIDTRKITPGCMFFALKGDRFDGNTFAIEALSTGAAYVIIDDVKYQHDSRTILVEDSLKCLQELAKYHRQYLNLPILALTGSNGKTTTKELINVVLAKKFRTVATIGNLNNHIGVPLTLLSFNNDTEIGIVEMGANHRGEIAFLCEIARPDYGYITNFGKAHLEGFGGIEGVILGKSELYEYLSENGKTAFVNLDDPMQVQKTTAIDCHTFGAGNTGADVNAIAISANPFVSIDYGNIDINSHLIGEYNSTNINAAVAIGQYFKVPFTDIKSAIENYTPENNRSQLIEIDGRQVILDAYNANPSSMSAAIAHFIAIGSSRKIAVLGDMFELGVHSLEEHKAIVDMLSRHSDIEVWFVGHDFYNNHTDSGHLHFCADFVQFQNEFRPGSWTTMLIKGSRGMALERTLQLL